jgi:hypothetical protein
MDSQPNGLLLASSVTPSGPVHAQAVNLGKLVLAVITIR